MRKKSDSPRVRISATVAARELSAVLDRVERGKSFLVHRHGRDVCLMSPPPSGERKASECLAMLRDRPPVHLDGRFGRDLLEILAGETTEDRPWA
jgi:antitoxin (DNA-binding transcriptional repressor) of toxin-antitoxin stability system